MSQSVLERLVVELTTDTTGLESGLQDAEQQMEQSSGRLQASAGQIAAAAGRAVLAIGAVGAAAGGALFAAANRAAAFADDIDKLSIRTRLGTGTLQELQFAADQLGVPFASVEANIRAFTGRLAEIERGGGSAAATFERLGVALRDDDGALRNTEALFLDTITALAGIENETEQAALAVQAFGEQGSALLPFLSAGPQRIDELRQRARELGLVLDADDIQRLVEYKDSLAEIQASLGAIVRDIAVAFLPALEAFVPVIRDDVVPALRDFAGVLGEWLEGDPFAGLGSFIEGVREVGAIFRGWVAALGEAEAALNRLFANPFSVSASLGPEGVNRAEFLGGVQQQVSDLQFGDLRGNDLVLAQIAVIDEARERARREFTGELLEQVLEDLFQFREQLSGSLGDLSPADRLSLLQASLGAAGIGAGQAVSAGVSTDAPGAVGLVPFEDAADAVTDGAEAAAGVTTRAALQFATTVAGAGASLADALRSGSPRAVGSSLASGVGGIVGLFNPAAGSAISVIGGLLSGFLPSGQATEASRAAGAAARGAPAVEFNLTQNNSIAVNGMPEFRDALTDSVTQLARVIETNLIPRITRLEANA
jgi:hypothetical protein